PAGIAPGTFIGRPSVEITTPETKSAGEAAPWEIVLRGSVALNLLPVQAPLAPPPAGVRVYMDPPEHQLEQTIDGVQSVAIYRGNVLAQSSGTHQTPTIQLPWYDISTGTMAMLELPGKTFETSAAPEQSATAMLPTTDVHSVEPTPAARNSINSTWLWTTALFALLWLITLAAWLRRNNMQRSAHHQPKPRDNEPRQRLLLALNARTLEQGLRQWEACYGHDEAIRAAIRTAQQLSYRKRAAQNDIELTQAIEHALALIGDCRVPTSAQEENHKDPRDDHWSPRAFRHAPDRE
ncbi:MAG: hypothetical protein LBV36_04280, partial [Chromatiales bacterium]|nr:hypothetical protein [Chromatiales bacterium]